MATSTSTGLRKRRTREHVIADLSVNHVERFVLRCGWTTERTRHDYGLDLEMKTYNSDGETESEHVLLQLKATDRLRVRDHGRSIAVRLDWRDVAAWCRELMPVILVLYDAGEDKAYWLHVQPYFRGRPRVRRRADATTTVQLPMHQVLNEEAVRQWGAMRDAVVSRFWKVISHEQ